MSGNCDFTCRMKVDKPSRSGPAGVLAKVFKGPELRSLTTTSSGRMITSSLSVFGRSRGAAVLAAGRFNGTIFVFENTAVKIKKNTKMTIMSIIGTMFRSSRP